MYLRSHRHSGSTTNQRKDGAKALCKRKRVGLSDDDGNCELILTTLIGGAAVVGAMQRLAAGARLAALGRAGHAAGGARAALARARPQERVARHVHNIAHHTASWNIEY